MRSSPAASHEASHSSAALATVTLLLSAVWVPARTAVADDGVMGVGIALAGEGLEVAIAVLVDVVDDPRLAHLAVRALPGSLAD